MSLPKQSPTDQGKCIIYENFINQLKDLSVLYDSSSFWDTVLTHNTTNLQCWQGDCENCEVGKKVIVNIDPGKNICVKNGNVLITRFRCIGELLESSVSKWDTVLTHQY